MISFFLALGLLLQPPSEKTSRAQSAALVKQLGSSNESERTKAAENLVRLGPAILADLPSPDDRSLSAEQKKHLLDVVKKLWRLQLETDVQGSWVDIPAKAIPLTDILTEIERQTGNPIRDQREEFNETPENPTIKWDGKKRRFWEAMDEICKQGSVRMEHFAGDNVVGIRSRDQAQAAETPHVTFGAIRVLPLSVTLSRQFTENDGKATVSLQVVYEPKIKPLLVEIDLNDYKVIDDKDREITRSEKVEQTTFSFSIDEGSHHFDIALDLASPQRDAQRIKSIKGSAVLHLPASNERFLFDDWFKETMQERSGTSSMVKVGAGKDEGDGLWSFQVFVKQAQNTSEGESFVLAALEPEVFLVHQDGTRLAPNAGKNIREEDGGLMVEYIIANAPGKMADYRIAVRTPAGISKIPVKFTLKDLPLP